MTDPWFWVVLMWWALICGWNRAVPLDYRICIALGINYTVVAAAMLIRDGITPGGVLESFIAGWCWHRAWVNRPPRRRKPSKVLARVRDLGHRLAVEPS
jgi:hypothetical protein